MARWHHFQWMELLEKNKILQDDGGGGHRVLIVGIPHAPPESALWVLMTDAAIWLYDMVDSSLCDGSNSNMPSGFPKLKLCAVL